MDRNFLILYIFALNVSQILAYDSEGMGVFFQVSYSNHSFIFVSTALSWIGEE